MSSSLPEPVLRALREGFPPDFLTQEPGELAEYGRDWTRVYAPAPSGVVFPRSTEEVARLLALCHAHHVAVVPSGGRTGLAAGAVAAKGELVLSLRRMTRMEPVDVLGQTVRVQAGAITEAVHQHCAPLGLTWPVDFASKGSSTVGGNIATNAGGVKVIRYGLTRQWVLGLQVVTADGQVLELNGALEKNNTGLDLRQLFVGSEGTLGVITEATLKLTRLPGSLDVLLLAVPDVAGVLRVFREARQTSLTLSAYEFFTDACLARVERHRRFRQPFEARSGCYVLMEVEGAAPDVLEGFLASLFERGLVTDGTLAQSPSQASELWAYRESISESLSATGLPHKNDIALPIACLEAFCGELSRVFTERYPGWEICLFGHIGDGNLHVNVMKPEDMAKEDFFAHTKAADHTMFELVRRYRGSISAEHGIGLLKRDYLSYSRAPAELALLRALKTTLDPHHILNPGKVLD
ncbi:MAG: FAD-binding oxidoreductase [Myxococcaceae bacterium]|nr:FAD-binding oxidoreductase [Myxococcaceae bacterium]MCI0672842.1 FAD-binding oxidoreductase [Myxococcaceae bacterium]